MTDNPKTQYCPPDLWQLVNQQPDREGIVIEAIDHLNPPQIICYLTEPSVHRHGHLIANAPRLLIELRLALQALDNPQLRATARKRGQAAMMQAIGCTQIRPDPIIHHLLAEVGIAEPTLTELALTTNPELAQAWLDYAQQHNLGNGFVVTQLRAGTHPYQPQPKRWFSEAEHQLFFTT